jgi:hypothetical protein
VADGSPAAATVATRPDPTTLIVRPPFVVCATYRTEASGPMPARKRMTVSTNKSGGWTLNLGGGQERQFTTETEAVQVGAREGRASGHAH